MKFKELLTGAFLLITITKCFSQTPNTFYKMPKVFPTSPEAAAIEKVSDVPIEYSSGTVNISIPLTTIKEGNISVPLAINYNTGGIKVQDLASMVGLGWSLSSGGTINVRGEYSRSGATVLESEFKQESDIVGTPNWDRALAFTNDILGGFREKQTPEYYYSFGQYSGSFFYDINGKLSIKSDKQNLRIEQTTGGFNITTPEGLIYKFTSKETVTGTNGYNKISAYFVTSIIDQSTNKTVVFRYKSKPSYRLYQESYATSYCLIPAMNPFCPMETATDNISTVVTDLNGLQLDSINFSSGYVKIIANNDRQDIDQTRITGIDVFNYNNQKIQSVRLNQSYFLSSGATDPKYNKRLRLDSLNFVDIANNSTIQTYKFNYNNSDIPSYKNSNGRNYTGIDYWGYYNGKGGNPGIIPQDLISNYDRSHYPVSTGLLGNRKVDSSFTQAFVLTRMQYPTGGISYFFYENNRVLGYQLGDIVGGLRIKKVLYIDGISSHVRGKYYNYVKGNLPNFSTLTPYSYDRLKTNLCYNSNCTAQGGIPCTTDYLFRTVNSDPIGNLSYLQINPFYFEVEEYELDNGKKGAMTKYYYDTIDQFWIQAVPAAEFGGQYVTERGWLKGNLQKKVEWYKVNPNLSYSLLKKEESFYTDLFESNPLIGVHIATKPNNDFVGGDWGSLHPYEANTSAVLSPYYYMNARNSHGTRILSEKRNVDYTTLDSTITHTIYEYGTYNLNLFNTENYFCQLKSQTFISSKNDSLKTTYYYSLDNKSVFSGIDAASSTAIDSLQNRNLISNPLQVKTVRKGQLLTTDRMTYGVWTLNGKILILPTAAYHSENDATLEQRFKFTAYDDAGNLIEKLQTSGPKSSYIWDYRLSKPVFEATNAAVTEVAYTSFEAENDGGWAVSSSQRNNSGVIGSKSYNLSNGAIYKPSLNTGKSYRLSYYSNSGAYTVTGITNTDYKQTAFSNGWVYYQYESALNNSTITIAGNGFIDDVKLCPVGALTSSVTFIPMVGVSSESNSQGVKTFYNYDGVFRLKSLLDSHGNTLKEFQYNYIGHKSSFNKYFLNNTQRKNFVKSNSLCAAGFQGSTVAYIVGAGSYYALNQQDADGLAVADVDASGQQYANEHGQCLPEQPVLNSLSLASKRAFSVDYTPIASCTSTIIRYTDISNGQTGATTTINSDCTSPKTVMIDSVAYGTFRVTVTCFSASVPNGVTSNYSDIYIPY